MTSSQLAKLLIAAVAGVCLTVGLAWEPDPGTEQWFDEALLGLALFLGLCSFHLP